MQAKQSIIDVYEEVMCGKRRGFPAGTWKNKENGVTLVRYLFDEKLKWSEDEIRSNLSPSVFAAYALGPMLKACFGGDKFKAIEAAFPNKYKTLYTRGGTVQVRDRGVAIEEVKDMIEKDLGWSRSDVCSRLNHHIFSSQGRGHILVKHFNNDPYEALEAAYPNEYKLWELNCLIKGMWTKNLGIQAMKWLIEDKLDWPLHKAEKELSMKVFRKYGLLDMMHICFGYDVQVAIRAAYPVE